MLTIFQFLKGEGPLVIVCLNHVLTGSLCQGHVLKLHIPHAPKFKYWTH